MSKLNIKEPEYKTWSLEKLQHEYFALNIRYTSRELSNIDDNERVKKAEALITAIKEMMELEEL